MKATWPGERGRGGGRQLIQGFKLYFKFALQVMDLIITRKVKVHISCSFCEAANITECGLSCILIDAK